MKWISNGSAGCVRKSLITVAAFALGIASVACSSKSHSVATSSQPARVSEPAPEVVPAVAQPTLLSIASKMSSPAKVSGSQLVTYKSRDYGVSFMYPWQYSFVSAKGLANVDGSEEQKNGHGEKFTLARIEIPKGFYPDTDFESGYFMLSLNEDLSEQECQSTLPTTKDTKVESESINGIQFRWMQTESGGHGSASTIRQYAGFANGTCYEVEIGVKSKNERGVSREVNPEQVLRRLERILQTVKIQPAMQNAAQARVEDPNETASPQQ